MRTRVENNHSNGAYSRFTKSEDLEVGRASILRGIVVNNRDPDDMCRVQVRIPSIHGDSEENGTSTSDLPWCPVLQQGAGAGAGSVIIPAVGTTVVLGFEGGSRDRPMVIGTVYGSGSTTCLQVQNTVPSQKKGAMSTGKARAIGNTELPIQGANVNTPVVYQSITGSKVFMNDTTADDNVVLEGSEGEYLRLAGNKLVMETASGGGDGETTLKGSHLIMNDNSSEYNAKTGQLVELASENGMKLDIAGKEYLDSITGGASDYAALSSKDNNANILVDSKDNIELNTGKDSGTKMALGLSQDKKKIYSTLEEKYNLEVNEEHFSMKYDEVEVEVKEEVAEIRTNGATIIIQNGVVALKADSLVDLSAPMINLGGWTRLG